jgi:hypothetical protein
MPGINLPARVSFPGGKRGKPWYRPSIFCRILQINIRIHEKHVLYSIVKGVYVLFDIKKQRRVLFSLLFPLRVALLTNGGVCYLL